MELLSLSSHFAVNRVSKSPSGERQEETEWFNIVAWRQLAETCNDYLKKGSKAYIEGRLTQRWEETRQALEALLPPSLWKVEGRGGLF